MKYINIKFLAIIFLIFISSISLFAQSELSVGGDLVSRYVWRGTDFGQSPSIQPGLDFSTSGFSVGVWGAYQLGRDASELPSDELDLYLGYSLALGSSSLDFVVTDYYFPNAGGRFGDYDGEGKGAHIIEVGATYTAPESFPIYLSAYVNVYNETDNSSYFEIGYSTAVKDVSLDIFAGSTPGGTNKYYGTDNFSFINIGITASKKIKISDDFSLPLFGSYIINPQQNKGFFVLGITI